MDFISLSVIVLPFLTVKNEMISSHIQLTTVVLFSLKQNKTTTTKNQNKKNKQFVADVKDTGLVDIGLASKA